MEIVLQQEDHALLDYGADAAIPDFSVCIPAYENVTAFSRCLESVLKQRAVGLEVVVSDDSVGSAIKDYVAQIKDPRVRYVHNCPALGVPVNWNIVLGMAKGKIHTLLHQDDWYRTPDALAAIYEEMNNSGAEVLIAGRALYQGDVCLGEYGIKPDLPSLFLRNFPARSLVVNRLGHPSVFFFQSRLQCIQYDASLIYFADTDYYNRILREAHGVTVCAAPLVGIMRGEQEQLSKTCVANAERLLAELFLLHDKYGFADIEKGINISCFFVSHIRHFFPYKINPFVRIVWQKMSPFSICAAGASAPFFALHMMYRLIYRAVLGKRWS